MRGKIPNLAGRHSNGPGCRLLGRDGKIRRGGEAKPLISKSNCIPQVSGWALRVETRESKKRERKEICCALSKKAEQQLQTGRVI